MLNKIGKSLFLINLLGFLAALFIVTVLHFYQVFVNSRYQPLPLSYWLKLQNLTAAVRQLTDHPVLPKETSSPLSQLNLKVDCQNTCTFQIIDQKTRALIKTVPAIVDQDAAARLTDLDLAFFDPEHQLIGYQSTAAYPSFYVINFQPDLLQTIQLNLNQIVKLEFVAYYQASQQLRFDSINLTTGESKIWLYHATKPELLLVTDQL